MPLQTVVSSGSTLFAVLLLIFLTKFPIATMDVTKSETEESVSLT